MTAVINTYLYLNKPMKLKTLLSLVITLTSTFSVHANTLVNSDLSGFSTFGNAGLGSVDAANAQTPLNPAFTAVPGSASTSTANDIGVAWYLTGSSGGISTTVNGLIAGDSYALTFYEAAANRTFGFDGNNAYNGVGLYWKATLGGDTGTVVGSDTVATTALDAATPWKEVTETFVATGATEVLSFLAQADAAVAPEPILLIGDVTLTPVPEPSVIWLLFSGMISLFGLKRRGLIKY